MIGVYSAEMGITLLSNIDRYTLEEALVELTYHLRISRSRDSADLDEVYDQTVESDGIYEAIPMGVFEVSEANRTVKYLELKGRIITKILFACIVNDKYNKT